MVAVGLESLDTVVIEFVAFLVVVIGIESTDVVEEASAFLAHFERDTKGDVAPTVIACGDVDTHLHDTIGHCADLFRSIDVSPLLWAE